MTKRRLLEFIEFKKITIQKFFEITGIKRGFLDSDKLNQAVSDKHFAMIFASFPELSPDWLITGKGEMLRNGVSEPHPQHSPNMAGIPLVEIEAVAGFGNADFAITEQDVKDYYIVPEFSLLHIDFMLKIRGSSMYPKYNSGDVVACTIIKERNFIQWNRCHIIATASQGILCKRLLPSERKGYIRAVSDNTSYPPFEIPEEDITGIALVVGVVRME